MALLPILTYPDERLSIVAEPVTVFDDELKKLASDMAQTMYEAPGVGLAAVQVNKPVQLIVIDISEEKDHLQVFVNPKIIAASKEIQCWEEGCLSLPGIYEKVKRPASVTVQAQDLDGNTFEIECNELLAVCIQHEMDHLKGTVFVDHLSNLKKSRITHKLKKHKLEEAKKAKEEAARAV